MKAQQQIIFVLWNITIVLHTEKQINKQNIYFANHGVLTDRQIKNNDLKYKWFFNKSHMRKKSTSWN